jgi:PAS domain S-box-containing protein
MSNAPKVEDQEMEALRRRLAELETIAAFHAETGRVLGPSPSPTALQEFLDVVRARFELRSAVYFRLDDKTQELVPEASSPPGAVKPVRMKLGDGPAGRAASSRTTVRTVFPEGGASLAAPVRGAGRPLGVLELADGAAARFTEPVAAAVESAAGRLAAYFETRSTSDTTVEARREDRYRSIVENAAYPIATLDPSGNFTWANRATLALLGYGRGELDGLNVTQIIRKGHVRTIFTAIKECAEGLEVRAQRIDVTTRRGEERTAEMSCNPLRENGVYIGLEMTLRDITDKVVIEKLKKNYTDSLEEAVIARTSEIKDTQRAAILAIANLAESIDDDTGGHIQRIQHYTRVLGEELRKLPKFKEVVTEEYVELIHDLSPLHDLGKVGIRDYILQKTDKLTSDEFEKMKEHTVIGAHALNMAGQMIHRESIFSIGEMIAHYHHEKWDGTGYPAVDIGGEHRPLRGEEIPLCARIVALADVYDALCSKRPYKMPFPHQTTREMIVGQSGKHFDPEVVQAFLRREQDFVRIREQFPDTAMPPGKPFELPARDRV